MLITHCTKVDKTAWINCMYIFDPCVIPIYLVGWKNRKKLMLGIIHLYSYHTSTLKLILFSLSLLPLFLSIALSLKPGSCFWMNFQSLSLITPQHSNLYFSLSLFFLSSFPSLSLSLSLSYHTSTLKLILFFLSSLPSLSLSLLSDLNTRTFTNLTLSLFSSSSRSLSF